MFSWLLFWGCCCGFSDLSIVGHGCQSSAWKSISISLTSSFFTKKSQFTLGSTTLIFSKIMYTCTKNEWETPLWLWRENSKGFGFHFYWNSEKNAKCQSLEFRILQYYRTKIFLHYFEFSCVFYECQEKWGFDPVWIFAPHIQRQPHGSSPFQNFALFE